MMVDILLGTLLKRCNNFTPKILVREAKEEKRMTPLLSSVSNIKFSKKQPSLPREGMDISYLLGLE